MKHVFLILLPIKGLDSKDRVGKVLDTHVHFCMYHFYFCKKKKIIYIKIFKYVSRNSLFKQIKELNFSICMELKRHL